MFEIYFFSPLSNTWEFYEVAEGVVELLTAINHLVCEGNEYDIKALGLVDG